MGLAEHLSCEGEDAVEMHAGDATDWSLHVVYSEPRYAKFLDAGLREESMRQVVTDLRAIRQRTWFEALAFCGVSGALVAPVAAYVLGCGLIAVRKPNVETYASLWSEGVANVPYLIVDDFRDAGRTIQIIQNAIGPTAWCVGSYFYGL